MVTMKVIIERKANVTAQRDMVLWKRMTPLFPVTGYRNLSKVENGRAQPPKEKPPPTGRRLLFVLFFVCLLSNETVAHSVGVIPKSRDRPSVVVAAGTVPSAAPGTLNVVKVRNAGQVRSGKPSVVGEKERCWQEQPENRDDLCCLVAVVQTEKEQHECKSLHLVKGREIGVE